MPHPKLVPTTHPVHELIARRWSPYAFADRMPSDADLRSLFEAARWAPSSRPRRAPTASSRWMLCRRCPPASPTASPSRSAPAPRIMLVATKRPASRAPQKTSGSSSAKKRSGRPGGRPASAADAVGLVEGQLSRLEDAPGLAAYLANPREARAALSKFRPETFGQAEAPARSSHAATRPG